MFFMNEKSLQNTDFAVIIVYLLMLLLVSILVSWISWMIRWLSRKDNGNLPRIKSRGTQSWIQRRRYSFSVKQHTFLRLKTRQPDIRLLRQN